MRSPLLSWTPRNWIQAVGVRAGFPPHAWAGERLGFLSGMLGNVVQELRVAGGISAAGGEDRGLRFSLGGE